MTIRNAILALITLFTLGGLAQPSTTNFSREQVLSDLDYLYQSLEDAHYDLYAYSSKEELDQAYEKVKSKISNDSLNLLQTTSLLQQFVSRVNNGHTEIFFPIQSYMEYAQSGGTLFPLELAFEDNKALVRKNWSDKKIPLGSEVSCVNGMSMEEILELMTPQVSAERPYFKLTKMEFFSFPRLYWQVFGEHPNFEVKIKSRTGERTYHLAAIDLMDEYELKREEVLNASMQLKFYETTAYLNPGNFSGDEPQYRQFIDSAMQSILTHQSSSLIIDLRNNQGGDNSFSDYLVSYIADKPFRWNSCFQLKSSELLKQKIAQKEQLSSFDHAIMNQESGQKFSYSFDPVQPKKAEDRFTGPVYVLVNRHSHSQSAVTAAQIQDYNWGTIVGEETGDYPTLYASVFRFNLPETGIEVQVPKGQIVRVNGSTKEEGVIPDIQIQDHLLDEEDEILNGLLDRLSSSEGQ